MIGLGRRPQPRIVDLLTDDRDVIRAVRWSEIAVVFQSALHALNPVLRIGQLIDDVLEDARKADVARRAAGPRRGAARAWSASAPTG